MVLIYVLSGLAATLCFLFHPFFNRFKFIPSPKDRAAILLGILFCIAGYLHFIAAKTYTAIMPAWIPAGSHTLLVYISGFFEMLGGLGLLFPLTRRAAGLGIIALLIAVFPANIDMALNGVDGTGLPANPVIYWVRLPFQFVFIAWAAWCSNALKRKQT